MLIDVHTHTPKPNIAILNYEAGAFLKLAAPVTGYISAGIHPWYADWNLTEKFCSLLEVKKPKNLIAIGECGLDRIKGPDLALQKKVFERQIITAQKLQLPVIIHQVKTIPDIFPFIKQYQSVIFVMHGYKSNPEQMNQLLPYKVYFSLGDPVLFPSKKQKEMLLQLPLQRIFFETDESDIALAEIYKAFANLRQLNRELLPEHIKQNFIAVFNVNEKELNELDKTY